MSTATPPEEGAPRAAVIIPNWNGLALLRPLQLRRGRYSKYLQGCRIFGRQLGAMAAMVERISRSPSLAV